MMQAKFPFGDQTLINEYIKTSNLNHSQIPNEYYVWGNSVPKHTSIFHHAVCVVNIAQKLRQMSLVKQRYTSLMQ
jgi:hypothetical protein